MKFPTFNEIILHAVSRSETSHFAALLYRYCYSGRAENVGIFITDIYINSSISHLPVD